jgi:hypothetical protein
MFGEVKATLPFVWFIIDVKLIWKHKKLYHVSKLTLAPFNN